MGSRIGHIALKLPLIWSFSCPFWAKFVSQASQELFKLEASNTDYICIMNDSMVGNETQAHCCLSQFLSMFLFIITC